MKSIRLKLALMYFILVFIAIIGSGTFTIVRIWQNEDRKAESELSDAADKVEETVLQSDDESKFHNAMQSSMWLGGTGAGRIECNILNAGGGTIATNVTATGDMPEYVSSVIITALNGETGFSSGRKYPDYYGKPTSWMEYARPVFDGDAVKYIIYARSNASQVYDSIAQTTRILAMGLLVALVVAVILGVFFANSLYEPIMTLTMKAGEFAKGDLSQQIAVSSKDEIGQLTESFNNMASELSQSISEIESEKNKLEIVLYNMTDGVLAYDAKGRLIHGNHVCKELLGIRDIDALSLDEMLERLGVSGGGDDGEAQTAIKDMLLNINGRFINTSCNYYKDKRGEHEGAIIMLQDMTKRTMLDNMLKEFVANVSHELKTPLTTIKSYAETLIDEFIETGGDEYGPDAEKDIRLDFLSTIDGETDRMTHLVNDLLELSRLDNKQLDFNMDVVNLADLVRHTVGRHKNFAEKSGSGHKITFVPNVEKMLVKVDTERINQVFDNIITNSFRYSKGATSVEVTIDADGDYYRVSIKDDGIGIPDEDMDRIFERFYRVDKARSRKLGGTGLGLSISKEIVESHGGKLSAQSRLGEGTVMTVSLLKYETND